MSSPTALAQPPASRQAPSRDPGLHQPMYLAGVATDASGRLEVRNPWNDQLVGSVAMAERRHIDRALEQARHYANHPLPEAERAALLEAWADQIDAAARPLAELLTRENGKTLANARTEIERAACTARRYATAARELNAKADAIADSLDGPIDPHTLDDEGLLVATFYHPIGVVTAFTPFNFPANTVVHKIAAAIAGGNACVLKPSEKAPLVALALARLFGEAGGPPSALSVLTGHWSDFVEPFLEDPTVDFFTMTGHSTVGSELYRRFASAQPFKRSHFELGGNAPQLCLADVDPAIAARLLATAVFDHSGSRCTTPRKILVPAGPWQDVFLATATAEAALWKTGDPLDDETFLGPLIDEAAARAVEQRVDEAVAGGARLLAGGRRCGASYQATVLADVRPDMRIFEEENFGPVMCVLAYESLDEAVRVAALGDHGLQPAVLTHDLVAGLELGKALRGGCINVGHAATSFRSDLTPFGGIGASGIGKEGGLAGVREMCVEVPYKLHPVPNPVPADS